MSRWPERTIEERFWSKVDRRGPNECWPWAASLGSRGYGQFVYLGRPAPASRVAWIITHGHELTSEQFVCHTCDNRPCCNPAHLWLGSLADNLRDMFRKGRDSMSQRTHCPHGHKYTPENTYTQPGGGRSCRVCKRASSIASWRRKHGHIGESEADPFLKRRAG